MCVFNQNLSSSTQTCSCKWEKGSRFSRVCVCVCVLVFWVSIFCKDLWWWLMVMVVGNGDCFGGKWCGGKGFEK